MEQETDSAVFVYNMPCVCLEINGYVHIFIFFLSSSMLPLLSGSVLDLPQADSNDKSYNLNRTLIIMIKTVLNRTIT